MKPIINLFAVLTQMLILIYSAATYGIDVGLWMLVAIITNAIQAVTRE